MTRSGREHLVEQFLGCEMNLDQEREFVMQVAVDPELFTLLRAYRLMDRALDRGSTRLLTAIPVLGAGTEGLGGLPGMAQVASHASATAASSTASTASLVQAGTTAAAFSSLSTWSVTVVIAILAGSAGFLVRPMLAPSEVAVPTPTVAMSATAKSPQMAPPPASATPAAVEAVATTPNVAIPSNEVTTGDAAVRRTTLPETRAITPTRATEPGKGRHSAEPVRSMKALPSPASVPAHEGRGTPPRSNTAPSLRNDRPSTDLVRSVVAHPDTLRYRLRDSGSVTMKPKLVRPKF